MLITGDQIAALDKGFSKKFRDGYNDSPEWGSKVSTTISSTHGSEVHGWMQRILKMRKWDGPRLMQNLNTHQYVLVNETYEDSVSIGVDEYEDENMGVYNVLFDELGRVAKKWPDQLLKAVLQNGATGLGFDGQPFFSTTHDLDPAGNQSNLFTSTALSATNFDTVRSTMRSYTGEDGEPMGVSPGLIVVPPALEKEALEIVAAERNTSGASNVLVGAAKVLVVPELADEPTVWYLMDVSKGIKPLIWQSRMKPRLDSRTGNTDSNVFERNTFEWGLKARGVAGYGPWWLAARCIA